MQKCSPKGKFEICLKFMNEINKMLRDYAVASEENNNWAHSVTELKNQGLNKYKYQIQKSVKCFICISGNVSKNMIINIFINLLAESCEIFGDWAIRKRRFWILREQVILRAHWKLLNKVSLQ